MKMNYGKKFLKNYRLNFKAVLYRLQFLDF